MRMAFGIPKSGDGAGKISGIVTFRQTPHKQNMAGDNLRGLPRTFKTFIVRLFRFYIETKCFIPERARAML